MGCCATEDAMQDTQLQSNREEQPLETGQREKKKTQDFFSQEIEKWPPRDSSCTLFLSIASFSGLPENEALSQGIL